MRYLVCLITALLLMGCASKINEMMDSWVGHHQSDLIAQWGPPNEVSSDGQGGAILIYYKWVDLGQKPGEINTDMMGNATYTAPEKRGYRRVRMFYVNAEGFIYRWRWQGF